MQLYHAGVGKKEVDEILDYLLENKDEYFKILKEFVELESPSHENKKASDKCGGFLKEKFEELGFTVDKIPQQVFGDHVYGEIGSGEKLALVIGHYDTVYPVGTIEKMPFKMTDGKAYGPGVLDMKGGIIMAYFAFKALKELNLMPENKCFGVFFNSDEETGSFCSSDLIVEKAREYKCALVMEPGVNDINSVKIKRYGRGTYEFTAYGLAAHSGSNSHLAISPLTEIAKQLVYIEEWNKKIKGATLAPTVVEGGIEGTCMVPESARFIMDVRYETEEYAQQIHEEILNLKAITPGIKLEIKGQIDKPVMIADDDLYEKAVRIGKEYGLDIQGISIGGGSDGNFTAAAGIPTLDGLGTTGEFLHNPKEYIHIDHVPYRTALFTKLLLGL